MVTPAVQADLTQPVVESQPLATPIELAPAPDTTAATPAASTTRPPADIVPPALTAPPQGLRPDTSASELATLRRQLADVEAQRQAEATSARLTQEAQQVQRDALARGLSEEDANWMAQRHYTLAQQVHQERESVRVQQQIMQGKINAAVALGGEYGISPSMLMDANSPAEMRAIGEREKRYAAQEARLKTLEQARVQPQLLNAASGSGAAGVNATVDNIDKLWFDYETQHPNQANPYEAAYRKLVYRR